MTEPSGATHPPHAHRSHPVVGWLLKALPPWPGDRRPIRTVEPGLYLDGDVGGRRIVAPRREVRMEISRVVSVVGGLRRIVGRVDLVAPPGGDWEVRYHTGGGDVFSDPNRWWLAILEEHYACGGTPVSLPDPQNRT